MSHLYSNNALPKYYIMCVLMKTEKYTYECSCKLYFFVFCRNVLQEILVVINVYPSVKE